MTGFNEESLRRDIVDKWGPAGAHVDVFDTLVQTVAILRDQKQALQAEIARLDAELRSLR